MVAKLKSGTYAPADRNLTVISWPTIKDEDGVDVPDWENYPDEFDVETDSAGNDYLILRDGTKRNKLVRDLNGEAITLAPGGAFIKKANGVAYTIGPDQVDQFLNDYVKDEDAPEPAPEPSTDVPPADPEPAPVDPPAETEPAPADTVPTSL